VAQTTLPLTDTCGINLITGLSARGGGGKDKASGGGGALLPPPAEELGVAKSVITDCEIINNVHLNIWTYIFQFLFDLIVIKICIKKLPYLASWDFLVVFSSSSIQRRNCLSNIA
jgi:hypothetical protein